ncbi:zinc-binding alcohol dehydrogenase family protein [Peribacillus simplex]|uniref:zinc-binding alcohol dehydrogenase family protein n=1 Tax=Peribacillus simplex TaxID=1478 RepID=UPI001DEB06AD|nr:zinc-binding alcohol dehydrogenase family protein [Peribacillus simplex]MED3986565.1 zinc-binding alcohol dehydrogenase family protein [Peribacillus simplex]MED4096643.1 zinc-binding alcohol dehydrogenase family protein [Peribacillus simplex]CAH0273117.1 putative zinc-type alcohol dehydrogenase-like protein YjmD [Peribacillus simplex]
MKAVQVRKAHELIIQEVEKPRISNSTDVLVKVKRVGICGSDMHIYHGTNPLATLPRVVGHEVAGEVVEIGQGVANIRVGDHVVVEPISYCGECYACRKGRQNVCEKLSVFGVHEDGGMREWFVLPEKQLHVVDSALAWEEIVLAEPYTIGAQAVWRGEVEEGETVLIQGAGPIGICILKMAKLQGASVMITDLSDERLEFAKESGADIIVHAGKEVVQKRVEEWTNGEGANVVIDAVCLPTTFELSFDVVSTAGRIVVLGFDERPSSVSQLPITKKEVSVKGSRLQTDQFPKVVKLLNEGKLRHEGLVTHTFSLDDIQEAFNFVENHPEQVRKAIIVFN